MKKINILIPALILLSLAGFTQQTVRFSNYLFNKMIINPAAAGSNDYVEIMGSYKKQWVGFKGAPETSFLSVDGSTLDRRLGLGLQVINDQTGALNQTGVIGNLSTRVRLDENRWLSVGFSTGWFRNTLNGNVLNYQDPNEIAIPSSSKSVDLLDFKAGIFYKDEKNFAGVSAFNIFKPRVNYTGISRGTEGVLNRHYYLFAGRVIPLSTDFAVIPSVLVKLAKSGNNQNQVDLNAKLSYRGQAALGLSYRDQESVGVFAEYIFRSTLRVAYSFDFNTNRLQNQQNGSHEIMIAYRIIQNRQLTDNPRYFYNN